MKLNALVQSDPSIPMTAFRASARLRACPMVGVEPGRPRLDEDAKDGLTRFVTQGGEEFGGV